MASTRLPDPPLQYDLQYMARLINQINLQFRAMEQVGPLVGSTLNLSQLPTSATGLRAGDVWVDTGAGNVLKIVP
jgi:hypothetical protein